MGGDKNTTSLNGEQVSYTVPTKIMKLLFADFDVKIQSNSSEYVFFSVWDMKKVNQLPNNTRKELKQDCTIFYRNLKEGLQDIANPNLL